MGLVQVTMFEHVDRYMCPHESSNRERVLGPTRLRTSLPISVTLLAT